MEAPFLNGIIAAAQEANKATNLNPEQVFIVLSDGSDSDETYLQKLVDQGYVKKLRSTISAKRNRFQSNAPTEAEKTKVTMGYWYTNHVQASDGFGDCFGKKNIYHAKDGEDVYKYILKFWLMKKQENLRINMRYLVMISMMLLSPRAMRELLGQCRWVHNIDHVSLFSCCDNSSNG